MNPITDIALSTIVVNDEYKDGAEAKKENFVKFCQNPRMEKSKPPPR